ncbi:23S rRNA (guanosine(2251)-2'-O)-methyltransferase RlmB [Dermatobacter hominis]|uniref:23S rRNA (guanosine(2251)-2'-O)-methyltransferase RlmB n=1 Tax=Dermatobacter hominis TaxID=2884263 RepID=UPI001D0FF077|nr:23S rRNA (guanosine(2251)-2'-O)-methyltransferase RlmB [Dermatobacter hominis]UDY34469.1 23S rRNA (guanosine(2251)-2'-O)-methyltransferase RlmB [Dermatobacter hominis]
MAGRSSGGRGGAPRGGKGAGKGPGKGAGGRAGGARGGSSTGGRGRPAPGGRDRSAPGGRGRGASQERTAPARPSTRSGGRPQRKDPGRTTAPKERGLGGTQVEGRQAVRELLLAGRRKVYEIFLNAELDRSDIVGDIVDLADELRVPITEVSRGRLDSLSHTEAPQGVVARAAELPQTALHDLCEPVDGRPPFLLALDGVTDPGNLGAVMRIAECAGVTGVVLPRHRAVHVTPTVTKAAAGAVEYLRMALVGGLPTAITDLREAGVWVVGLDAGGDTSIHDLPVATDAVCLVLGAEGKGLSRLAAQRCDLVASIPLHGHLSSLNVASAGAVACYEIARRRPAAAG